jgi:hypothetical protein
MRAMNPRADAEEEAPPPEPAQSSADAEDEREASPDEHDPAGDSERREQERRRPSSARTGATPRQAQEMLGRAREQLRQLHGSDAEAVSSFERTQDGWVVTLEVVELRRIPASTDVLASYRVQLDANGDLLAFERTRRYHRAEAGDGLRR